jgi:putative protein kinase ArgK-like GTPase of G3E family
VEELLDGIGRHRAWMDESGKLVERRRGQLRLRVESILKDRVLAAAREEAGFEARVTQGFEAHEDPYRIADGLFRGVVAAESGREAG